MDKKEAARTRKMQGLTVEDLGRGKWKSRVLTRPFQKNNI